MHTGVRVDVCALVWRRERDVTVLLLLGNGPNPSSVRVRVYANTCVFPCVVSCISHLPVYLQLRRVFINAFTPLVPSALFQCSLHVQCNPLPSHRSCVTRRSRLLSGATSVFNAGGAPSGRLS